MLSKYCVCRYLCDEALDTEALREALSQRVDGAEEVKKEMREDIAEDKRKLKVGCCSTSITSMQFVSSHNPSGVTLRRHDDVIRMVTSAAATSKLFALLCELSTTCFVAQGLASPVAAASLAVDYSAVTAPQVLSKS